MIACKKLQNKYHTGTSNHCCAEVVVESDGETNQKHSKRLGRFYKFGTSKNNRFSYRQQNGDSYLYWQKGIWMVRFSLCYISFRCWVNGGINM